MHELQETEIYECLHRALIEIRATEKIKKARVVADIFHNVPLMLKKGRSVESIVEEIKNKAIRLEALDYVKRLYPELGID